MLNFCLEILHVCGGQIWGVGNDEIEIIWEGICQIALVKNDGSLMSGGIFGGDFEGGLGDVGGVKICSWEIFGEGDDEAT